MTKHLITSALPYINGTKHLGNLAGSLLPADVQARHLRQCGGEVLFVCGTDEHGTPAEIAAAAAGLTPREFCDREHLRHREIYEAFGLSFDRFGRTSDPANHHLTQKVFLALEREGFIEERETRQFWSAVDGRFLPDRYILGTCPRCGHSDARGDQCDACSATLDPTDLGSPRSAISGAVDLELRATRHLFLRQSALAGELVAWLHQRSGWSPFVSSIARGWLAQGLRDRSITRDLSWGIPVPKPGWEGKVFYVWFDAPLGYIAASGQDPVSGPSADELASWWDPEGDIRYIQFLGKDNVPFHAVSFPCTLLGSRLPIRTVDVIKGFHWLTYEGGKFSTSQGRGVFLDQALEILPADGWRWWLCANSPESSDTDFSFERLAVDLNADLADNLGNFVNRVFKYISARHGGIVPAEVPRNQELEAELDVRLSALREAHDRAELRRAANEARAIWSLSNGYVARSGPWISAKTDPEASKDAAATAVALVRLCALTAWPFVPGLARTILDAVGEPPGNPRWLGSAKEELACVRAGIAVSVPSVLFEKIDDAWVVARRVQFGGTAP
ncbi:MAG: methionine--tRNA ligase [Allorhizobium sp.]